MTHLAAVKFDDTLLEVGTGPGYQSRSTGASGAKGLYR
jgi:protein-L-isoaspartate O-methyltransferase